MLTPAAKRRRVEAAANTLKKPFRSPLIKRPPPQRNGVLAATPPLDDASRDGHNPEPMPHVSSQPQTSKRQLPAGSKRTSFARSGEGRDKQDQVDKEDEENEEGNAELRELIVKWKAATRMAAEEVFGFVKERVDSAGGTKAWKGMQRRQNGRLRGFDATPSKVKHGWDEDSASDGAKGSGADSDDEAGGAGEADEDEEAYESNECRQGDGCDQGDAGEPVVFHMGMMLRSLNINPKILGYSESEDTWVD